MGELPGSNRMGEAVSPRAEVFLAARIMASEPSTPAITMPIIPISARVPMVICSQRADVFMCLVLQETGEMSSVKITAVPNTFALSPILCY